MKFLSKLQPIMPRLVSHWLKVRELADAELRSLIDKQIISTAYQVFGDFHNKILLSLPSEKKAAGSINLGTVVYDKARWPLGLKYGELIQNAAILGRSGAGKTNVTFHILRQLVDKKIPFVFLDWKRTVRHLLPQLKERVNVYTPGRSLLPFSFNPFVVPPGVEVNVYVNQLVDVMSQAFRLGDGSRSLVRKAIAEVYGKGNLCPLVGDVISELDKMPDTGRAGGWKVTAMRALESLEFANITSPDQIFQERLAEKMLTESSVIELDALAAESKKFLIPMLSLWLYYVRMRAPDREKLKLVIFIEEAHHVLHKRVQTANETVLEMLFRQCRELGIGIVVIDQHPHLLSAAAMGNTYTSIFLNQKDPADINKAAAVCLMDADEKKYFSMLPVGQGIVKLQDRWMQPIHVQFPHVEINKGSVTDDILARYSASKKFQMSGSGRKTSSAGLFRQVPRVPLFDIALDEQEFAFLEDVIGFPHDGVKQRYKRLGFSTGNANRIKQRLIDQGWLETQMVELGQTRKVLLRLTQKARDILDVDVPEPQRGSLVHEYWKHFYAQRFSENGYKVQLEAPRKSGNVDVLATKDNQQIAIEIETGKSDFLKNVKQNILSGFDKIISVATDKKAFSKIEKELAKAGIIGLEKVQLALIDDGLQSVLQYTQNSM